jgi:hypothetical protein
MLKTLACRIGRHDWTTRIEQGESYKVCTACGKTATGSGKPPMSGTDLTWMQGKSGP